MEEKIVKKEKEEVSKTSSQNEIKEEEISLKKQELEKERNKNYNLKELSNQELLSLYNLLMEYKSYLELEKKKVEEEEK